MIGRREAASRFRERHDDLYPDAHEQRTSNARSGRRNTGAVMRAFLAGGGGATSPPSAHCFALAGAVISPAAFPPPAFPRRCRRSARAPRGPLAAAFTHRARERLSLSVYGSEISRGAPAQCHLLYPPSERVGRGSGRGGLRETSFIQRKTLPARSSRPSQRRVERTVASPVGPGDRS